MKKLAFCAGHYLGTPGKRLPKSLDAAETREWTLNNRIADYLGLAASWYDGVVCLRTDDSTGANFVDIPERTAQANAWGADLYIDIHHNAAGRLFDGGGVEAYCYPGSGEGRKYRDAIYKAVVNAGGLKGNRANPLQEKAFDSLSLTNMPAVLVEYGYMDSRTDAPVILTNDYAQKVAFATMEAVARLWSLEKKSFPTAPESVQQAAFVKEVQRALGVAVTGIPDKALLQRTPTISATKNNRHRLVAAIRQRLLDLGYGVGKVTDTADARFTDAVVAFQQAHRCQADGEITAANKTWRCLLGMEDTQ